MKEINNMNTTRNLDALSVAMLAHCMEFEEQMRGAGIKFVRTCTYRSADEQDALYAQGRTAPGRIITWAKGGQSRHNDTQDGHPASNAADYYPLVAGKLCGDKTDAELALWAKLGQIAVACGLEWGGNWKSGRRDLPHVQMTMGKLLGHE